MTGSGQLISDLQLVSEIFTPNGDGANDQLEVRFVTFKTEGVEARVEIFNLAGRRVASLTVVNDGSQRFFNWDGRGTDGVTVEPGVYVLRVDLGADAGSDTATRTIAVAY